MARVLVIVRYGVATVFVEDENTKVLIVDYDHYHRNPRTVRDMDGEDCVVWGAEVSDPDTRHTVAQVFDHFK